MRKLLTILATVTLIGTASTNIIACGNKKKINIQKIDIANKLPNDIYLSQLDIDNSKSSFLNALQKKLITIQDLNNITIADYDVYQAGTTNDINDDMIINTNWLAIKIVAKGDNFTGIKDNITTEYTRNISHQSTIYFDKDGNQQTTAATDLSDLDITEIMQIGFYQNNNDEIEVVQMPKIIVKVPKQLPLEITILQDMFNGASTFNQDIANWDVSHVTNMNSMFNGASAFNQDLSHWNVAKVTVHDRFAANSGFANDVSKWPKFPTPPSIDITNKIPNDIYLGQLNIDNSKSSFLNALQAQLTTIQDLNNITIADYDVYQAGTTNDINDDMIINTNWLAIKIVAKGDNFTGMKDNITTEYTRNINHQSTIYFDKDGNQQTTTATDLSDLDITEIIQIGFYQNSNSEIQVVQMPKIIVKVPTQLPLEITSLQNMFVSASIFNEDISNWNTSKVINMSHMFVGASVFNEDISKWNTSKVTNMSHMFANASVFNQDISSWNVANVTDMSFMFDGASNFNQDIANWNVAKVTTMLAMFQNATNFNQDISTWNVANVTSMGNMFFYAKAFNQDLSQWNVKKVTYHNNFAANSGFAADDSKWPKFIN